MLLLISSGFTVGSNFPRCYSVYLGSNRFLNFPESLTEDSCAEVESEDDLMASRTSLERQAPHRGNTTVHVCWHRNTSVSMVDFSVAVEVPQPVLTCPALPSPPPISLSLTMYLSVYLFPLLIECASLPWGQCPPVPPSLSVLCHLDIRLPQCFVPKLLALSLL